METYNKMVSIFIHLQSGANPDNIFVKIHSGGMIMSFFHKIPEIFKNTTFMMNRYGVNQDDDRVITMGMKLYNQRIAVERGSCDDLYYEMKIDLPFSCFERPVAVKRGDEMTDIDVMRFKHDIPELRDEGVRYLGAFIELSALNKMQSRAYGHVDGRF